MLLRAQSAEVSGGEHRRTGEAEGALPCPALGGSGDSVSHHGKWRYLQLWFSSTTCSPLRLCCVGKYSLEHTYMLAA